MEVFLISSVFLVLMVLGVPIGTALGVAGVVTIFQFVLGIEGLKDACEHFGIPIVSGNVSFYNETNGLSIYPTPMLGMVGLIEKADRAMSQWFRVEGDEIVLLGKTRDELGGSEYLKVLQHREQGSPPLLNLETEKALHDFVLNVIDEGLIQSAHDCSDGGFAVALSECCVSGPGAPVGAMVKLDLGSLRRDALLFGESQSRIIVSIRRNEVESLLTRAAEAGIPAAHIGTVGGDRLVIDVTRGSQSEGCRIELPIQTVQDRWAHAIEDRLSQE